MATEIKPFSSRMMIVALQVAIRLVDLTDEGSGIGLVALFETDNGESAHEGDIMWSAITQEIKTPVLR